MVGHENIHPKDPKNEKFQDLSHFVA